MARIAECPHCQLVYKLRDDAPEGDEVVCESCLQTFVLKSRPLAAEQKPVAGPRFKNRWAMIAAGSLVALLLLGVVYGFLKSLVPLPFRSTPTYVPSIRSNDIVDAEYAEESSAEEGGHAASGKAISGEQHTADSGPSADGTFRVVVDASFGGEGWEAESTEADDASPSEATPIVRQMQSRDWTVDVVPADYRASPAELARIRDQFLKADLLIRPVGNLRRRHPSPLFIKSYQESVRNGAVLLLWGRHPDDRLAAEFGLRFNWFAKDVPLSSLSVSEMTTRFDKLEGNWTGITRMPIEAIELAWVHPPGHAVMPVLGYLPYGKGMVIFCGADQRLTEPMQEYLMSLATAVDKLGVKRLKAQRGSIRSLQKPAARQSPAQKFVPGSGNGGRRRRSDRGPAPQVLIPEEGATLPQPDRHPWVFDWADVENASEYHLILMRPENQRSAIRKTVQESQLTIEPGTLGTENQARTGWVWYVRAIVRDRGPTNWSTPRPFEISKDPDFDVPQLSTEDGSF